MEYKGYKLRLIEERVVRTFKEYDLNDNAIPCNPTCSESISSYKLIEFKNIYGGYWSLSVGKDIESTIEEAKSYIDRMTEQEGENNE